MAIELEFIDFVVPRSQIDAKYPGGWDACIRDHRDWIGRRIWYDDHLFRDGAMSPMDIHAVVERWEGMGFEARGTDADGNAVWKDVCVVEGILGGPTLPCEWLVVERGFAYLRGTEPGEVRGRSA